MIRRDSTSFPVLAACQHFRLTAASERLAYQWADAWVRPDFAERESRRERMDAHMGGAVGWAVRMEIVANLRRSATANPPS